MFPWDKNTVSSFCDYKMLLFLRFNVSMQYLLALLMWHAVELWDLWHSNSVWKSHFSPNNHLVNDYSYWITAQSNEMAFVIWFWVMCIHEARILCVCGCVTAGVHVFQWDGLTINSWLIDESPALWPITSPSSLLSISASVGCVGVWACERGAREVAHWLLCSLLQPRKWNHLFRIFRYVFSIFSALAPLLRRIPERQAFLSLDGSSISR